MDDSDSSDPISAEKMAEGMRQATKRIAKSLHLSIEDIRELHIAETPGWTGERDLFGVPVATVKWWPNTE